MSAEDLDWRELRENFKRAIEPVAEIAERNLVKLTEITDLTKCAISELAEVLISISQTSDDPEIAQKSMKGLTTQKDFGFNFKEIITREIED